MNETELIRSDPYLRDFLNENRLNDDYLKNHLSTFRRVFEDRQRCLGCKGLNECRQPSKGQRLCLSFDQVLSEEIEFCPYGRKVKEKNDLIEKYVYCDIPQNLADIELDKIEYTPDQKVLYLKLAAILTGKSDKGLYINGELGTGKTYLCTALANSLVRKGKRVAFVKVNNFINQLKSYYGQDEDLIGMNIRKLQRAEYLFLDDIGSESVSEFVRDDVLFRILDYRLENRLTTIFTSNLDLQSLKEHYQFDRRDKENPMNALRLMERIEILSDYYVLTGENKRRQ